MEEDTIETPSAGNPASKKEKGLHMTNPYQNLLERQKDFFRSHKTLPVCVRKAILQRLKSAILAWREQIEQALYEDLGKQPAESWFTEIGLTLSDIDWQIRHLQELSMPRFHYSPVHQFPSIAKTFRIPYGSVLVMSPWNYPFLLAMMPAAEALAAGNTVVVKTGHAARATSAVMTQMIQETFPDNLITCIEGGHEQISALLELDFDYIFFTGGKKLGSIVMESASRHLIPVTLELGGKSPAVVDESANLALAAKRIVFGKFLNAGQTCVAPDYCLVHESKADAFVSLLKKEIEKQYPDPANIGKIIDQKHFDHLISLIDPDRIACGGKISRTTLQIEPTVLYPARLEDPIMQEEIFGPILPIVTYSDFSEMMAMLQNRPTPLAFYLFTRNREHEKIMETIQPFGGGCINDTVVQLSVDDLPFGGMGSSGMGQYHGRYGYQTFTHEKAVLHRGEWPDFPFRYANRKPWMEKILRRILS